MNSNERQIKHKLSGALVCLFALGLFSRTAAQTTNLNVRVTNIAIAGEISARGLTAAFPHPVLAAITVTDNMSNPILGLANTSRWLAPQDITDIGLPVVSIWKRSLEYHRDNRAFPPNPDIYDQLPAPLITEFRASTPFPTSTMLVMDISGSMIEELDDAKAGNLAFLDQLRPSDRAGLIQFCKFINNYIRFTDNRAPLRATIAATDTCPGTAIYDALIFAIQQTRLEKTRRAIILYTDGYDNESRSTEQAVIDSAQAYNIPIHTISLGDGANPAPLRNIARNTGGLFFQTDDVKSFADIYKQLAAITQNFYMLAYGSPDPARNDTWRRLDVTVCDPQMQQGSGTGDYFVPGGSTLQPTDLAVTLTSFTNLSILENGRAVKAAQPGDRYTYRLQVKNLGPERAESIRLNQILPPAVSFIGATSPPFYISGDSLNWQIARLDAGAIDSIIVTAQFSANAPSTLAQLISRLTSFARNDNTPANNTAQDTVRAAFAPPPNPAQKTDLAVSQFTQTDSFAVSGNDTLRFAKSGGTIRYQIVVANASAVTAQNIRVTDFFPDSVRAGNFQPAPASSNADSIVWTIPNLPPQSQRTFSFMGTVSSFMPVGANLLINQAVARATNEDPAKLADNASSDTVYNVVKAPPQLTDLALSLNSRTISTIVESGRVINAARPGEPVDYKIRVRNLGPNRADNIRVRQLLPDSVRFVGASQALSFTSKDSVVWQIAQLNSGGIDSITVTVQFASTVPTTLTQLISRADLFAATDNSPANNFAADTIRVITPPPQLTDLALSLNSRTISTIVENGRVINAARPGESIDYKIRVSNLGPNRADNIRVRQLLPDSVRFVGASQALSFTSKDSVVWQITQLNSGGVDSITVTVLFAANVPQNLTQLISRANLFAATDNSPANNFAADTIRVLSQPPLNPTDLAVTLASKTALALFENGRVVNAAAPGQRYEYRLGVRNLGPARAENIRLRQSLPDSVRFVAASKAPFFADRDSLVWQPALLNAGGIDSINVTVQFAPKVPQSLERLISRLTLFAVNDNSASNNAARDTVRVVVPPPAGTLPLIEASPPEVTVGDSVRVRVQVLAPINTYDLWVYFANGQIDSSFADAFIKATRLAPNVWYDVMPHFTNTRLFTAAKEEQLRFEIRARDIFGSFATASDAVVVRSNNDLVLDSNVYEAELRPALGINFKLSSNRVARLDVYDLNGVCIAKLVEAPFNAGWNTYNWNGLTEAGRKVGSGVYIIALRSGEFTAWKKCIIVR